MSTPTPQIPPPGYYPYPGDEIDLRKLWRRLMLRKWLILLFPLLTGLGTGVYAFSMTPVFRAEVLLQPVSEQKSGGGLGALAGNFGGLAALAGVNLEGLSGGGDKSVAMATLKSRVLTEQLIEDKDLLPVLFREQWDAEKKDWKASDTGKTPSLQDGFQAFDAIRKITEDKKNSGLVILSIEWRDPKQAAEWATELVRRTNVYLQDKAGSESQRNLDFLESQIQQTSMIEMRQSLFTVLEQQMKKAMLAKASQEYAFKIIDPAVVPERKFKPKRALMTALGAIAGFFAAIFFVLVKASFEESEPEIA